jgi:hypothetical protein
MTRFYGIALLGEGGEYINSYAGAAARGSILFHKSKEDIMKKGLLFLFTVLLMVTFAGTAAAILPITPITPITPIIPLNPCFGATFTADLVNITEHDLDTGADHWISVVTYELESGGTTVGHGFSKYTSQQFASGSYVASEETVIIDALSVSAFGQSSNTTSGLAGSRGVITNAITFNGQRRNDIMGTYMFSDFTGSLEICAFITP